MVKTKILIAFLVVIFTALLLVLSFYISKPEDDFFQDDPFENERILEKNYVEDRIRFYQEKPWAKKLPIKTDSYFISYNPEDDSLLATVYYYSSDEKTKTEEINTSKNKALEAILDLGVNIKEIMINFTEIKKEI